MKTFNETESQEAAILRVLIRRLINCANDLEYLRAVHSFAGAYPCDREKDAPNVMEDFKQETIAAINRSQDLQRVELMHRFAIKRLE